MPLPAGNYGLRKTAGARVLKRKPGRKPGSSSAGMKMAKGTLGKIQETFANLNTSDRSVLRDAAAALASSSNEDKKAIRRGMKRSLKKATGAAKSGSKRPLNAYMIFANANRTKTKEALERSGKPAGAVEVARKLGEMWRSGKRAE
jgi:hypothetical protein